MPSRRSQCVQCGSPATSLCSRCRAPYCSRQCQLDDWKVHRRDCAMMAAAGLNEGNTTSEEEEPEGGDFGDGASLSNSSSDERAWRPSGARTFYPRRGEELSERDPMGRPVNTFDDGRIVDWSFASPDVMAIDRNEMVWWLIRTMTAYHSFLGCEVESLLLNDRPPARLYQGRSRLKVIYLAGVEGTGHHGILPMLLYAAVRACGLGVLTWWRSLREVLLKTPPSRRRARLAQLLQAADVEARPHVIIAADSWPFGEDCRQRWSRGCLDPLGLEREEATGNPGNSVDLGEFVQLLSDHGDVRILALHRGLLSAAYSHKEWDGGLVPHAKVLALFNEYLTGVLQSLDPASWRWVSYEDLCEAHRCQEFQAVVPIAEFLELPRQHLVRAFRHFSPSTKDAFSEVHESHRRTIERLEAQRAPDWFPARSQHRQLLSQFSDQSGRPPPPPPKAEGSPSEAMPSFLDAVLERRRAACREEGAAPDAIAKFEATVAEAGELQAQAMERRRKQQELIEASDLDASAFTSLHMWIEDRGFGSEFNNLVSAAIYCEENDLECVVEDSQWNSGRLHDYLEAEPIVRRESHLRDGRKAVGAWRPLEVQRSRTSATPGWFALQKHALTVSREHKAAYARTLWRLTPAASRAVAELNAPLDLPPDYGAVHLRRGDKVIGRGREAVKLPLSLYAQEAAERCLEAGVGTLAICSDDSSQAQDLVDELSRLAPSVAVRWRRSPLESSGHQQAAWNALPLRARVARTHELLADMEVLREATFVICTFSSNVGRLAALLREGPTQSLDEEWTNT